MSFKHSAFRMLIGVALGLGIIYSSTALLGFLLSKTGEDLSFLVWLSLQLLAFFIILISILGFCAQHMTRKNRALRKQDAGELDSQAGDRRSSEED